MWSLRRRGDSLAGRKGISFHLHGDVSGGLDWLAEIV
jgi:hypothetical protein